MSTFHNYYALLGLPVDASGDEIRAAYRELARRVHPDTSPDPEAAELFIQIQQAFEVLIDPNRRRAYDASLPQEVKTPPFLVSEFYSRASLNRNTESQLLYVLLNLEPNIPPGSNIKIPLNVSLVVDCSTSMQGLVMDKVKATAIEIVKGMRPQDIISVIAFHDRAEVIVPAGHDQDHKLVETSIRMLKPGGGTEIYRGLQAGFSEVQRYRSLNYINHIILITDGRTYGDEVECEKLAQQAAPLNVGISGLGIGSKWNDAFIDRLAAISGGNSLYVSKPSEVTRLLKEKFSKLGLRFAEHIRFDFKTGSNASLNYAFRIQPEESVLPTTSPIILGAIQRNAPLTVLLEFVVNPLASLPPEISMVSLATGRILGVVPERHDPNASIRLELTRLLSEKSDMRPPPQPIIQAMSRLTLYRIQEKARQEIEAGNILEGTRRLQYLATHLLAHGERDLARTVLAETAHAQKNLSLSEEGEKRIKYGTRSLLLPPSIEENRNDNMPKL